MFDRLAAIAAARTVLDAAPRVDVNGASEPVIDIAALVDAIVKGGDPDALIVPAYDEALAQFARFRLEQDGANGVGAHMVITARSDAVSVGVHRGSETIVAGLTGTDMAWHAGLALCCAALEAKRLHEEAGS